MSHSGEISLPHPDADETADDWRAMSDAIGLLIERLTEPVEGMHMAIAQRWFGLAGPRAQPAATAYSVAAAGVYESVRIAGYAVGSVLRLGAVAAGRGSPLRPLWKSPAGMKLQATANALWGDELARRQSPMSIEMSLRDTTGVPIPLDRDSLERAFPDVTPRVVVMVHGLAETERCWQRRSGENAAAGFAETLTEALYTPLLVRYNSGRRIADNGTALAEMLDAIVERWPVAVEEVALVGNSMGGLVARSAAHAAHSAGHHWFDALRHVVAIASPHLGAPLEKGVNLLARGLSFVPESRPLGTFLDRRSAGIKDLRFGAILETDWPPDVAEDLNDGVAEVSPPDGVQQHFVAGVVTADPAHPIGVLVGDLMVRVGSGTGRGARRTVETANVHVLGGRRHFDLLHDADVQQQVAAWLGADRPD